MVNRKWKIQPRRLHQAQDKERRETKQKHNTGNEKYGQHGPPKN